MSKPATESRQPALDEKLNTANWALHEAACILEAGDQPDYAQNVRELLAEVEKFQKRVSKLSTITQF